MTDQDEIGRDRLGAAGDDVYAALMEAHDGLSFEESVRLNTRLVLLLANRVGDLETLKAVLEAARKTDRLRAGPTPPPRP